MSTELSAERQELLKNVVAIQERMLNGVTQVFHGLKGSSDPEVVVISEEALRHLKAAADTLEAMIDGINETKH